MKTYKLEIINWIDTNKNLEYFDATYIQKAYSHFSQPHLNDIENFLSA